MNNNRPNPFNVLGLSPEILSGLRPEDIHILINGAKKSLQLIHHPDRGGDQAKSELINWAVAELDPEDPDRFEAYLKLHTETDEAKKAAELLQLQAKQMRQDRVKSLLWQKLLECIIHRDSITAARRQIRIYTVNPDWDDVGIMTRHTSSEALARQKGRTIDVDSKGNITVHTYRPNKPQHLNDEGLVGTRNLERRSRTFDAGQKILIGCIPQQTVNMLDGTIGIFRLCAPEVMRPDTIEHLPGSCLPNYQVDEHKRKVISVDGFAAVAEYLSPFPLSSGLLFSLNRSGDQQMIECEGQVTKVVRIRNAKPATES